MRKCYFCNAKNKLNIKINIWLILLAIFIYLNILWLSYRFYVNQRLNLSLYSNWWRMLVLFDQITSIIAVILVSISLLYFYKKKKKFITIFNTYMIFIIIIYIIYYYLSLWVIEKENYIDDVLIAIIIPIIWILYLIKSTKVKNTFIN